MAVHRKAVALMEPMEAMARLAARASERAEAAQTRASGSASWDNGDGTRTVIGPQAGSATMATHVGDVTPPPVPTGIRAWSGDGSLHVLWAGSLAGDVPADFDHVTVMVDGRAVAEMRSAGSVTVGGLKAGSTVSVTATAEDDACLADGTPAHNVSAPCAAVSVTIRDAVAEVRADADAHGERIEAVRRDIADYKATSEATYATKAEVDERTGAIAKTLAADYTKTADLASTAAVRDAKRAGTGAASAASAAQSAADTAKANASAAQSTADSAKSAASKAQSTADGAKSTADSLATMVRQDSSGVTVGKSSDGKTWSTGRTRMTADAYQVLDKAGTVITQVAKDGASFLAGLVRIVVGAGTLPGDKTTDFISVDTGSGVAGLRGIISRLDAAIDGITSSVSAGWEQDFGYGVTAITRRSNTIASAAHLAPDKAELHVGDDRVAMTPDGFELSDPAAMLSALGLGAAATYQAAKTDPTLTYDSTTVLRWGRVCAMPVAVHYTRDWAPSEYAFFTLPEGVRPSVEQRGTVAACPYDWASDYRPTLASIGTDGRVKLSGCAAGHWIGQLVWVV